MTAPDTSAEAVEFTAGGMDGHRWGAIMPEGHTLTVSGSYVAALLRALLAERDSLRRLVDEVDASARIAAAVMEEREKIAGWLDRFTLPKEPAEIAATIRRKPAPAGHDALAARDARVRREALEEAFRLADRRCILPGDCEHLGPTDWETGVRECALEVRDEVCPCSERVEEAETIRAAIRALLTEGGDDAAD